MPNSTSKDSQLGDFEPDGVDESMCLKCGETFESLKESEEHECEEKEEG